MVTAPDLIGLFVEPMERTGIRYIIPNALLEGDLETATSRAGEWLSIPARLTGR